MAESEAPGKQDYIAIGGSTEFEDDDAALEALVQLKELTFGEDFDDRDTSLDSEESDGISILFHHSDLPNKLRIYTTEDGHVHITCTLFEDSALNAQEILETISEEVGKITIGYVVSLRYLEIAFSSLDFPIQEDTEYNVTGIRISESEANYITQATDEQGVLFISRERRLDEEEDLTEIKPLGTSDWEAIDEFIDKFA